MTPEYLEKLIRDVAPQLRAQLLSAFYAASHPEHLSAEQSSGVVGKLDAALLAKDKLALFDLLGISADGTSWPRLDTQVADVLTSELLPVFDATRHDAFKLLAESADDYERDKTDYQDAIDSARQTIVALTLAGTIAAIDLILATPARYGFTAAQLIASIGMTNKQAKLYFAAIRKAAKIQIEVSKHADDIEKQAATLQSELQGVPVVIANAIRRAIREGRTLADFSLDDTRRFSKAISQQFRSYRADALSRLLIATVANTTELGVWKQAQRDGVIGLDAVRVWKTAGDERVRHKHEETAEMNAGGVALDEPFRTPFGVVQGPPLEVNCRCTAELRDSGATKRFTVSPSRSAQVSP